MYQAKKTLTMAHIAHVQICTLCAVLLDGCFEIRFQTYVLNSRGRDLVRPGC